MKKIINPIGIGTARFATRKEVDGSFVPYKEEDSKYTESLIHSLDNGQNHIDLAHIYGGGYTEKLVGRVIKNYDRNDLFIATKVWKDRTNTKMIVEAVKKGLDRTGLRYLDLLYLHKRHENVPLEDYIKGLVKALDLGLTKNIGICVQDLSTLRQANKISGGKIKYAQINYNLIYKKYLCHNLREYCQKEGIKIVCYSPFSKGKLFKVSDPAINHIKRKYGATTAQVALSWLVSQGFWTIPMSFNKKHIDENLDSLNFKMDIEDIKYLSENVDDY